MGCHEDLRSRISEARREIHQLHEAVVSHAVIDQAVGVIIAVGGLRPGQGIVVLEAVAQRTGTGLGTTAEHLVDWAGSGRLRDDLRIALDTALADAQSGGTGAALPVGGRVAQERVLVCTR
ncbi:ANTAR domain-containing protein [Streptomyces broussonetiae]|uniref:ANTAR domain-containing protein n=1 Tax=Streptomyces broussonetiae TaxID=2686304 RepID=A0A6I6N2E1_9ACTN|nr:ANTAR domain-containing protein [Streptomyces broussonetiae]QHA03177.1 ANTAR domain-containing protein [Streptomyces broussonetiae]